MLKGVKKFCDLHGFNFTIYGHVWTNVEEEEVRRWRHGEDGVTLFRLPSSMGYFKVERAEGGATLFLATIANALF